MQLMPEPISRLYGEFGLLVTDTHKVVLMSAVSIAHWAERSETSPDPRVAPALGYYKDDFWNDQSEFARRQVAQDHPFLHSFATVALWSSLEIYIKDFLIALLGHSPKFRQTKRVMEMTFTLSDYEELSAADLHRRIVNNVENDLRSKSGQGIRHEALLSAFNLGGPLPDKLKRTLIELALVRNVIVHNSGVVNEKLVSACPWLRLTLGDTFTVSASKFSVYIAAIALYANLIYVRALPFFAIDPNLYSPLVETFQERFASALAVYDQGILPDTG